MRFFHLSDLHIGKQLYGYSLLEDQEWVLNKIYELIDKERPDGVLIAGMSMTNPCLRRRQLPYLTGFLLR